MSAQLFSLLSLWLAVLHFPVVYCAVCSPAYGLVHVGWNNRHEVQYQLDCTTWAYFCEDAGWGDEEATVVCRELGYSYGVSGIVPIGRVYRLIDRIECGGSEERLQDCLIEPASDSRSPCTQIGTIASCHNVLPQVLAYVDKEILSEEDSFHVCVHINGTRSEDITVSLQTFDGSALAGFDYLGVGHELHFVASEQSVQCVEIEVVDDSLAETEEWFGIRVSTEWPLANVIETQLQLHIEPSDNTNNCNEGSVTVVSDVNNSSLQLVEMCSSEGVWSPVCDYDWTADDATVVCREMGHKHLDNILHTLDSAAINAVHGIPECSGNEDRLSLCMNGSQHKDECRPALVDCSSQAGGEEVDVDKTRDDSENGATDSTEGNGEESGTRSIDLAVIIAISVVLLVLIVLVLVLAIITIHLCRGKRKRKVQPRVGSSGGMTQQANASHDENIIVNALYVNFDTSLTDSTIEHTYSPVFEPPTRVHEYAILEVGSPPLEENSNLYHVLEGDGSSPVHYTVFNEPRAL